MIWLAIAPALAAPVAPIREVEHPRYVDAAGAELTWGDVRELARDTDARRKVTQRRVGRTLLRSVFAGATAVEVWGATELARRDNYLWAPLAGQAALTGACAVLLWTRAPGERLEDRALLLNGLNASLRTRP